MSSKPGATRLATRLALAAAVAGLIVTVPRLANAQAPAPSPPPSPSSTAPPGPAPSGEAPSAEAPTTAAPSLSAAAPVEEIEPTDEPDGYTPPEAISVARPFTLSGYLDVGLVKAQGNGTSFPPGDTRLPVDYGVDPFAPMVNTRGDVASTDSGGLFTNGFLPRSVGIADRASFLINTLNLDLRYQTPSSPFMIFSRVQFLPRHLASGDDTRVFVEQAFGRFTPFSSHELNVSVGKVDSVFGIEYLETQSNIRTGITPSLLARYTVGTSVGTKVFVRQHIAPLWSAVTLNVAATNSAPFVESLQTADASLTGSPNFSARLGYELNLPWLQVKLGGSGLAGPRNDQRDRHSRQRMLGGDVRVNLFGLSLAGEYIDVEQDPGAEEKQTGLGTFPLASEFAVDGYYVFAGYTVLSPGWRLLKAVTAYGRYSRRHATFTGFRPVRVASVTGGLRFDLGESVILKGEILKNDELDGAPDVKNDVYTSSLVFSW